jgi:hypothetical protein
VKLLGPLEREYILRVRYAVLIRGVDLAQIAVNRQDRAPAAPAGQAQPAEGVFFASEAASQSGELDICGELGVPPIPILFIGFRIQTKPRIAGVRALVSSSALIRAPPRSGSPPYSPHPRMSVRE